MTVGFKATDKSYYLFCRNLVINDVYSDVRNVLVIVALRQKDSLRELYA